MQKFLQTLLIVLALALCGFNAVQWVREAHLRAEIQGLSDKVHDKMEVIQRMEGTIKKTDAEVARLDALKIELTETVRSNKQEIANLTRNSDKLTEETEAYKQQLESYKQAVSQANEAITRQNEDIKKQNAELKQLAEERNAAITKFNKVAADFNELVTKWNQQQEELTKAAQAAQAAGDKPKQGGGGDKPK